jgi:hypothetical protein
MLLAISLVQLAIGETRLRRREIRVAAAPPVGEPAA